MRPPAPWVTAAQPAGGPVFPAFTLVESLVAASVVLFALSVLTPALGEARDQGHLAGCLANLRGIGQASLVYAADDPNEMMIPVPNTDVLDYASGAIEWGGKAGIGEGYPTTSRYGTGAYRGPAHRPLNPYVYKREFIDYNPIEGLPNPGPGNINWLNDTLLDLDIYRCPSDTGYAGGGFLYTGGRHDRDETYFLEGGLTAYDHFGSSYVANTFWITGGLSGNHVRSQSVYLTPLSRVPYPAHSIAYQETPSRFAWLWGSWCNPDTGCCWTDRESLTYNQFATIPGWHGQDFHFNVTFADGHAATVKMQGCDRPSPDLGYGNYPPNVCGVGTDPYHCHQCVTVRGPGWSMDTLPEKAVPTPFWYDGKRGSTLQKPASEARNAIPQSYRTQPAPLLE